MAPARAARRRRLQGGSWDGDSWPLGPLLVLCVWAALANWPRGMGIRYGWLPGPGFQATVYHQSAAVCSAQCNSSRRLSCLLGLPGLPGLLCAGKGAVEPPHPPSNFGPLPASLASACRRDAATCAGGAAPMPPLARDRPRCRNQPAARPRKWTRHPGEASRLGLSLSAPLATELWGPGSQRVTAPIGAPTAAKGEPRRACCQAESRAIPRRICWNVRGAAGAGRRRQMPAALGAFQQRAPAAGRRAESPSRRASHLGRAARPAGCRCRTAHWPHCHGDHHASAVTRMALSQAES